MPRRTLSMLVLIFCASMASAQSGRAPSFVNDVEPILTRLGCNQGSCHGKGSGQNGFRLSLRGYAPEWDHAWITREFTTRRINPTFPEHSLLLQKPTGQVAHEGGVLMQVGSREYKVLLEWIRAGAPGIQKDEPTLKKLALVYTPHPLGIGETLPLVVRAEYTDGQTKDVTWLTKFDSNDSAIASVSAAGMVKVERSGETAIRAMFQGQVAVALVSAPYKADIKPEWYARKHNLIDEHVFKKLRELRIEPSDPCDDHTFIRRVFLDAMGALPTPDEVRSFVNNTQPDKRARLVDAVLERPEFVDFWTLQMNDLLMNRRESDHDVRGPKGVRSFHEWIRKQVALNRPWDEMTRDILTVTGNTNENPAVGYFIVNVGENRESHKSTVVANVAQTFLGVRIGCAQCHNHPLEKYTQDDYYHFAGYFSRIKLDRKEPKVGPTTLIVSTPEANQNKNPVGVQQPRTGKFMAPQALDRTATKIEPGDDPRKVLVDWMTHPKNDYFAGAMVNRIWAHFFNVGLVEPIDDLRDSNPPSNPELWNALIREFVAKKYDRKHVMRLILNSRAYQLSVKTKPTNEKDLRFYSHYMARRLPSEVLHDAIYTLTGVADDFPGYPKGIRAVQVPSHSNARSVFFSIFGPPERLTACACERSKDVHLGHTLHLLGGDPIQHKITAPVGRLTDLLKSKKSDAEIVDELIMVAWSRLPSAAERKQIDDYVARNGADQRRRAFEDILWALMNSKEFTFNR